MPFGRCKLATVSSIPSPGSLLLAIAATALFGCANAKVGYIGARDAAPGSTDDTASGPGDTAGGAKDAASTSHDDAGNVVYSPCNPFTNAGCSNGQKCAGFQTADRTLALACGDKGSKAENDTCAQTLTSGLQTGDDCGDGLSCFNVGGKTICRKACPATGADPCPNGETCSMTVPGFNDPKFCTTPAQPTTCQPLEQTGCPANQACYYSTKGAVCATAGTIAAGSKCNNSNDCVKGSTCLTINGSGACHAFCSTASGATLTCSGDGTGGSTCVSFNGASDEPNLGSCR